VSHAVLQMHAVHACRHLCTCCEPCCAADACQHKLQSLGKYITDVEAFVNIHMDALRNRMIKFEILLTAATFTLGIYAVVAGVLGENLPLAPHVITRREWGFVAVNASMTLLCTIMFVAIMSCARRNGLM
jgi:Mg2+ and Co2+ transporter CorA